MNMRMLNVLNQRLNHEQIAFKAGWEKLLNENHFTQIPNCLLTCFTDLNLTVNELVVTLNLIRFAYGKGQTYVSVVRLRDSFQKDDKTIRRYLQSLEGKGLLRRELRPGKTTIYRLELLREHVEKHILTCPQSRQKSSSPSPKMSRLASPGLPTEEYYPRRIRNKNNAEPIGNILKRRSSESRR